jgi:hypothetical protein
MVWPISEESKRIIRTALAPITVAFCTRRSTAWRLLVIGGFMLAAAAFGALFGCKLGAVIPLALWGAILAGGVLVERWRYQLLAEDRPGHDWQATLERFVDPETCRLVTVFFNSATDERRYVADDNRRPTTMSRANRPPMPMAGRLGCRYSDRMSHLWERSG